MAIEYQLYAKGLGRGLGFGNITNNKNNKHLLSTLLNVKQSVISFKTHNSVKMVQFYLHLIDVVCSGLWKRHC